MKLLQEVWSLFQVERGSRCWWTASLLREAHGEVRTGQTVLVITKIDHCQFLKMVITFVFLIKLKFLWSRWKLNYSYYVSQPPAQLLIINQLTVSLIIDLRVITVFVLNCQYWILFHCLFCIGYKSSRIIQNLKSHSILKWITRLLNNYKACCVPVTIQPIHPEFRIEILQVLRKTLLYIVKFIWCSATHSSLTSIFTLVSFS